MAKETSIESVYESPENPGREGSGKKGSPLLMIVVVTVVLGVIGIISMPLTISRAGVSRATRAINNGKDIYVGLRDYAFVNSGQFPDKKVSSNEVFNQLFNEGVFRDEKPFFINGSSHVSNSTQGDENGTLNEGENVFAYWINTDGSGINCQEGNANTPILTVPMLTQPLKPSFNTGVYSTEPFGGQAVVVQADGAAMAFHINNNGLLVDDEKNEPYRVIDFENNNLDIGSQLQVCYPLGIKKYEPNK